MIAKKINSLTREKTP